MRHLHIVLLLLLALCALQGYVEADVMVEEAKDKASKGKGPKGKGPKDKAPKGKGPKGKGPKGGVGVGAPAGGGIEKPKTGKGAGLGKKPKACDVMGKPMKGFYQVLKMAADDEALVYATCVKGKAVCSLSAGAKTVTCPKDAAELDALLKAASAAAKKSETATSKKSTSKKGKKTTTKKKAPAKKDKKTPPAKKTTKKRELQPEATNSTTPASL